MGEWENGRMGECGEMGERMVRVNPAARGLRTLFDPFRLFITIVQGVKGRWPRAQGNRRRFVFATCIAADILLCSSFIYAPTKIGAFHHKVRGIPKSEGEDRAGGDIIVFVHFLVNWEWKWMLLAG